MITLLLYAFVISWGFSIMYNCLVKRNLSTGFLVFPQTIMRLLSRALSWIILTTISVVLFIPRITVRTFKNFAKSREPEPEFD